MRGVDVDWELVPTTQATSSPPGHVEMTLAAHGVCGEDGERSHWH